MKITAKSRYALRVLQDIAMADGDSPRPIKEIARSQGISEKFISRIAVPLRRAKLLETARGAKGGLTLARLPEQITLLDIVQAMDGPLAIVHCLARPGSCSRQYRCAAVKAWGEINDALATSLRGKTLADIIAVQRRLSPAPPSEPDYCI